jgi:hypothetical protein
MIGMGKPSITKLTLKNIHTDKKLVAFNGVYFFNTKLKIKLKTLKTQLNLLNFKIVIYFLSQLISQL